MFLDRPLTLRTGLLHGLSKTVALIGAFLAFWALSVLLSLIPAPAHALDGLHGHPDITDGDTLRLGKARVRLHGIDAPEQDQYCKDVDGFVPCGAMATQALGQMIGEAEISCTIEDVDRYGRAVATCFADGVNLNAAMAEEGWAVAMPRYSDAYLPNAGAARAAKRGIWAYDFHMPGDWRKGERW